MTDNEGLRILVMYIYIYIYKELKRLVVPDMCNTMVNKPGDKVEMELDPGVR